MHVLLQLKSYDSYIDMVIESKKSSDWENFAIHLVENKELERKFVERLNEEKELKNMNEIILRIWNIYKKHSMNLRGLDSDRNAKNNLKLLSDILDIIFSKECYLNKTITNNHFFINLNLMIKIKCLKDFKEESAYLEIFSKLKIFLQMLKTSKINVNLDYLKKFSKSEEINLEIDSELETILNENNSDKNSPNKSSANFLIGRNKKNEKNGITDNLILELNDYREKIKIPTQWKISEILGIGLIGKDFNVQNKIPGWEFNSVGYHSDDGNIFIAKTIGESYGPVYGTGDVIGCCVNFLKNIVFFTKNGKFIKGISFETDEELYPAVGLRKKGQSVQANFGDKKFYFDFDKYYHDNFEELMDEILSSDLSEFNQIRFKSKSSNFGLSMEPLILDYLVYQGYSDTYYEILNSTGKIFYTSEKVIERKEINEMVKYKKFDDAKSNILKNFKNSSHFCSVFLNLSVKLWNIMNSFMNDETSSNLSLLTKLRKDFIYVEDYKIIKEKYNFYLFEEMTQKLAQFICHPLEKSRKMILEISEEFFDSDKIFHILNKHILETEYNVYNNELDTIYKQIILSLRENLKCKKHEINFLFNNKNFLRKLNDKHIKNPIIYSDINMSKAWENDLNLCRNLNSNNII